MDQLREVKSKVMELFAAPELNPSYRQEARSYLEQFYRTLEQPSTLKRAIIDPCVRVGM